MTAGKITLVAPAKGKSMAVADLKPTAKKLVYKAAQKVFNKNTETKERNHVFNEQAISVLDTYPTVMPLTEISSGRDDNQRIGNAVNITKLQYKLFFHNSSSFDTMVRILVVRSKGNLSDTDISQGVNLFKDGNSSLNYTATSYPNRLAKDINRNKYTVLSDKQFKLSALNSSKDSNNKIFRFTKIYKNKKLQFSNQSDAIATNPIKVLIFNVDSALDSNVPVVELTGETSIYYKDA